MLQAEALRRYRERHKGSLDRAEHEIDELWGKPRLNSTNVKSPTNKVARHAPISRKPAPHEPKAQKSSLSQNSSDLWSAEESHASPSRNTMSQLPKNYSAGSAIFSKDSNTDLPSKSETTLIKNDETSLHVVGSAVTPLIRSSTGKGVSMHDLTSPVSKTSASERRSVIANERGKVKQLAVMSPVDGTIQSEFDENDSVFDDKINFEDSFPANPVPKLKRPLALVQNEIDSTAVDDDDDALNISYEDSSDEDLLLHLSHISSNAADDSSREASESRDKAENLGLHVARPSSNVFNKNIVGEDVDMQKDSATSPLLEHGDAQLRCGDNPIDDIGFHAARNRASTIESASDNNGRLVDIVASADRSTTLSVSGEVIFSRQLLRFVPTTHNYGFSDFHVSMHGLNYQLLLRALACLVFVPFPDELCGSALSAN